jgi:hypothetical protein
MKIIPKHTEFIQNFLQDKNSPRWQNIHQNTAPDLQSTTLLPVVIKHCWRYKAWGTPIGNAPAPYAFGSGKLAWSRHKYILYYICVLYELIDMIKGQPKQLGTFLLRYRNMVGSIFGGKLCKLPENVF